MDYKKDRDNTVKLDINSDGCKNIWMVTEQENAYDKAVAVGHRKSKFIDFSLKVNWKIKIFTKGSWENSKEKLRHRQKRKMRGMMIYEIHITYYKCND